MIFRLVPMLKSFLRSTIKSYQTLFNGKYYFPTKTKILELTNNCIYWVYINYG